jgi:lysophospholipase L1-like esterase
VQKQDKMPRQYPRAAKGAVMLKGKRLSILGDSISTYQGVSNNAQVRATTAHYPYHYRPPFPIEKTYWHRVCADLGLTLCVNNSYSGGNLSGRNDPDSGVCRAIALSGDNGGVPDIIIIFMGINDLGRGVDVKVFSEDYELVLETVGQTYPNAAVCCVNLPDRDPFLRSRTERFNLEIENAVSRAGKRFFIADLFHSRLRDDFYYMNTTDGLHPDEDGMAIIAQVITDRIKEFLKTS